MWIIIRIWLPYIASLLLYCACTYIYINMSDSPESIPNSQQINRKRKHVTPNISAQIWLTRNEFLIVHDKEKEIILPRENAVVLRKKLHLTLLIADFCACACHLSCMSLRPFTPWLEAAKIFGEMKLASFFIYKGTLVDLIKRLVKTGITLKSWLIL